ncbi:MAG: family 78 glycoside hydrolase catalytic domain [Chitinophagaceae bacterium]|nr:family 78 glycoside hydrolase catalytic domain [Chitinophagaceae bacterium]
MKRCLLIMTIFFVSLQMNAQQLTITNLRCESRINPLGVDVIHPKLRWELQSKQHNVLQTAYRILVADDEILLKKNIGNVWDSKQIKSSASIQVTYSGKVLQSAKRYFWKVQVWDNKGNTSSWSSAAHWQMGLLQTKDWSNAKWIAYENLPDSIKIIPAEHGSGKREWGKRPDVLPLFRKTLSVTKKIKQATAFICGLGQFEMSINGKKVGDHFLDPGWTKYSKQVQYVTFDITDHLKTGSNAVGVILGNGFYYIPSERYRKMTGAYGYPKMIAKIVVEYADGTTSIIVSDESWKTSPSPITYSSLYGGENYDATLEQQGWNESGFDDKGWKKVVIAEPHVLVSQTTAPIKVMQQFSPISIKEIKTNMWVYDFGQNMSGIPEVVVNGKRGDTIRITPAELLKEDGTANQRATGSTSYYQYILKGDGDETWHPRFTYYGFRYVQVDVFPTEANRQTKIIAVKALHTRNSAADAGSFTCSNELFNQTNKLIKWAINSNMQSVFTDCPHRERLGWQEQLHLMGNALQYNYDIHTLAKKITADIRAEQNANGLVPSTIPEYTEMHFADGYFRDSPEWGSNAILFPWNLYQWYGDKGELLKNYATMQKYMQHLRSRDSSHLLMYGLSDWYDLGPNRPGFCQLTPMGLTATAYYYHDIIMNKTATLLGKKKDAMIYVAWADSVKLAFNKKYYHPETKQYGSGSQTSNAIAVSFGLVNEKDKAAAIENLVKEIEQGNYKLTSGDIGFHHLLKVLNEAGRNDIIYLMNNRTDVPGYGYQIVHGATALTESWQGLPIVSNNHFMLGHLMEWFYTGLAGIKQTENSVAYKEIMIRPEVVGDMTNAKASFQSPYGLIKSEWAKTEKMFELIAEIPANSTAVIYGPVNEKQVVLQNGKKVNATYRNGRAVIKIGSGNYRFTVEY